MTRHPMIRWVSSLLALGVAVAAGATSAIPAPVPGTPRRALRTFVDAARSGDFATASRVLDLSALPERQRAEGGPRLARQLSLVLDQELWLEWERISDDPAGDPSDGPDADVVGALPLHAGRVPVRLVRGDGGWRIGPGVVAAIPSLYAAHGPGWIGERMPPVLMEARFLEIEAWQWIGLAGALAVALFAALALGALARRFVLRLAHRTSFRWDDLLVDAASGPARLLLGTSTFAVAVRALHLAVPAQHGVDQLLRIAAVVLFCWALLRMIGFGAALLVGRTSEPGADGAARARLTQIMVLRRIVGVVVVVVGGALVLLQFDALRAVRTSVLASAGVAGIVVGLAAQRTIATLLAGLQISLTQPVRVGDVVVIEGEWGTIEEITLTYAVVKIWDLRRLVVPITRILDAPFQNWTRAGSEILGTVLVRADYRVPVDTVRQELDRFVATRPEWDGKVAGLQVTDASDRAIELRALVSSADASSNWGLRCAVREHLLSFLQRLDDGRYLPRTRIETPPQARNVVAATAGLARPARQPDPGAR